MLCVRGWHLKNTQSLSRRSSTFLYINPSPQVIADKTQLQGKVCGMQQSKWREIPTLIQFYWENKMFDYSWYKLYSFIGNLIWKHTNLSKNEKLVYHTSSVSLRKFFFSLGTPGINATDPPLHIFSSVKETVACQYQEYSKCCFLSLTGEFLWSFWRKQNILNCSVEMSCDKCFYS